MFFCEQKTADEMRISDWSSDVCSSDLPGFERQRRGTAGGLRPLQDSGGFGQRVGIEAAAADCTDGEIGGALGLAQAGPEERRGGKRVSVRVGLGGRRVITKTTTSKTNRDTISTTIQNRTYIVKKYAVST